MASQSLCDFCQTTIFNSNKTWDYHHRNIDSVCASINASCVFCDEVYGPTGSRFTASHPADEDKWPLYRWSVRRPGTTRESQEYIVIVFRPTQDHRGESGWTATAETIPERTFFLVPDQQLKSPKVQDVGCSTNSPQALSRAKAWLADCITNHPKCRQKTESADGFVPTRLLDISALDESDSRIRIIKSDPAHFQEEYATLSHCWGTKPFINLTAENEQEMMEEGFPWKQLPPNFTQAIEVARTLGFGHIWIDSLCIMQGDSGDFPQEAPLMHKVYRNSGCNIAATDSADAQGGLFRNRVAVKVVPGSCRATVPSRAFGDQTWGIIPGDYWKVKLFDQKLYSRGWVFQERMLAPRILHYSSDQVFWDCASMSACEAFPAGIPRPIDTVSKTDRHWRLRLRNNKSLKYRPLAGPEDSSLEIFWRRAVDSYTRCDLTRGSDKLMAIWGIAKLVRDAMGQQFLAGLWSEGLVEQLAWKVVEGKQANGLPAHRPLPLRQPSWSWASMDGIIQVHDRLHGKWFWTVHINPVFQPANEREFQGWSEELSRYDKVLASVRETFESNRDHRPPSRKWDAAVHQDAALLENNLPKAVHEKGLEVKGEVTHPWSIPMRCDIGKTSIERRGAAWDWAFPFHGSFAVHPDVDPGRGSVESYFIVLAFDIASSMDGVDRYSGLGILVKPVEGRLSHFERWGAFDFDRIAGDVLTAMQGCFVKNSDGVCLSAEYDEENGHKIWLD